MVNLDFSPCSFCPRADFEDKADHLSLVCVTVSSPFIDTPDTEVEKKKVALQYQLSGFLRVKPDNVVVREVFASPQATSNFLITLPSDSQRTLFDSWRSKERSALLQQFCLSLTSTLDADKDPPIANITNSLGSEFWPFPSARYYHCYFDQGSYTSMAFSKERCPDDKDLQLAILISQG